jgi:hypothetical protein
MTESNTSLGPLPGVYSCCQRLSEAATADPWPLLMLHCRSPLQQHASKWTNHSQRMLMAHQQALLTMSNSLHWNLLGSFWQSMQAGPSAQGVQAPEVPELPCSTTA